MIGENTVMKDLEKEYRMYLPKKSYAVVRVDGKGFSKYTKKLEQPFDEQFTKDMRATALYLAQNIDGAHLAYTQSDEISVVFSDLSGANTEWWYGGQVQKIVSIVAAMATAKFNELRPFGGLALFDARVHTLSEDEVFEYLKWRQNDAIRNSISMLASAHFSHKQLQGVGTDDRLNMLASSGIAWFKEAEEVRQGSLIKREWQDKTSVFKQNGQELKVDFRRHEWVISDYTPSFFPSQVKELLGLADGS